MRPQAPNGGAFHLRRPAESLKSPALGDDGCEVLAVVRRETRSAQDVTLGIIQVVNGIMKFHMHTTRMFCANHVTALLTLVIITSLQLTAAPLGTAFIYQGRLNSGAAPANGSYDLRFAVFDAAASGAQVGSTLTNAATPVANGLFTVALDFGAGVFDGNARWLEIAVRPAGGGAFTSLTPRQPLAPAPHALYAPTAGAAATATSAQTVSANAVTSAGIASGQVVKSLNGLKDAVRLAAGSNVTLATNANTLTISAAGGGATGGWTTTGNAGTTPADSFLGTTDGQPLVLRANNVGVNTNDPQATLHVNGTARATRFEGDGGGLTGINASLPTPFTLTNLANVHVGGVARGVAIQGHFAIVANGYDGLRIFDVEDPTHPTAVAHKDDLGGDAETIAVTNTVAFIGTSRGLVALDVSPLYWGGHATSELARMTTAQGVRGVAARGNWPYQSMTVFLANDTEGLRICSLWNPFADYYTFDNLSVTNNGGRAWDVAVAGDLAFLANEADGLRIYGVTNLARPVMLGHAKTPDRAFGVAAAPGNLVYVASGNDGVLIYDVSNPSAPALVRTLAGSAEARRVTISGQHALVAWNDDGIRSYDIADPRNPVQVGHAPIVGDGFSLDVVLSGSHAYAANEIGGLGTYLASPVATVAGLVSATGFSGDGSKLTQLNASQLTGQLPDSLAWKATGNAGTSPVLGDFLGTTDNQPLELRVNGKRALRLEPGSLSPNVIGGHAGNMVSNGVFGATIGGGGNSGYPNRVGASYATVVGGEGNTASGSDATAMGFVTTASGHFSTAMGLYTRAMGERSTAMGDGTTASGFVSTAMGFSTTASGEASTAMGRNTTASGTNAFAAGRRAKAIHEGAFVWADSQNADFASTTENQFLIRAAGGVGINNANPTTALDVMGNLRINDGEIYLRGGSDTFHGLGWYGSSMPFAGQKPDGPVLYGCSGGVLGTACGTPHATLTWGNSYVDVYGNLGVTNSIFADSTGMNAGDLGPGLKFGGSGSGEGLASKRTAGGNQFGLDLYTGNVPRLSIDNAGRVGIGTTVPSDSTLDVRGDIRLNDCQLLLRGGNDRNHGLRWSAPGGWAPGGAGWDGPVLYGSYGGLLGTTLNGNQYSLIWNSSGHVVVRGTLSQGCDRAIKTEFEPVNPTEVLDKVAVMPLQTWRYKADGPEVRHLGPVSQDFRAAFGLGADDKHIDVVDATGVALAAIQGLNRKVESGKREAESRMEELEAENAELKERLTRLEQLVQQLIK